MSNQDQSANIVRVERRDNPYVVIDKTALLETELSWKAKGIHAYLLSLPDDWKIHERDLVNRAKDGRDGLRAGLKELIDKGYMKRTAVRNDMGKIERWETIVYEIPQNVVPESDFPQPESGFPEVDKPILENPTYTNYPSLPNNQLTNSSSSEQLANVFQTYQKNIEPMPSGIVQQKLLDDIDTIGHELVLYAIEEAAVNNKRSYAYMERIMRSWRLEGINTLEAAKARSEQWEKKGQQRKGFNKPTKEKTGGWGNAGNGSNQAASGFKY